MTSLKDDGKSYLDSINNDISNRKLFYIKEICDRNLYKDVDDKELHEVLINFISYWINVVKQVLL